jgi:hypothetical protein
MTSAGELLAAVAKEQERDSLGDIARRERKGLLAASLVALATSWGDLIPNKIEALGLTVEELDPDKLLLLLALVVIYFVAAFSLYAYADYSSYKVRDREFAERANVILGPLMEKADTFRSRKSLTDKNIASDKEFKEIIGASEATRVISQSRKLIKRRLLFDIWLPLSVGTLGVLFVILDLVGLESSVEAWTLQYPLPVAIGLLFLLAVAVLGARKFAKRPSPVARKANEAAKKFRDLREILTEMKKHGKDSPRGKALMRKFDQQLSEMSGKKRREGNDQNI